MTKFVFLAASLGLALLASPALAKDAKCYTSDDGEYACRFEMLDKDGSFKITARGKPSFELTIDSPGTAFVSAQFEPGGRYVSLPGTYIRSKADRACWVSDATEAELCAW